LALGVFIIVLFSVDQKGGGLYFKMPVRLETIVQLFQSKPVKMNDVISINVSTLRSPGSVPFILIKAFCSREGMGPEELVI